MVELAHPWVLIFLPLPFLVWWLVSPYRQRRAAVRVPFFDSIVAASGEAPHVGAHVKSRSVSENAVLAMLWALTLIALAAPERVGVPIERIDSARDIMVAVDLSSSMAHADFPWDGGERVPRIVAVKRVLQKFADQRQHDRLGLIVFGDAPYLQAPFTDDHQVWRRLLIDSEVGMAGLNTSLGDAIGLAIRSFRAAQSENRVLVVLTDGNDTRSRVPPIDAAKVAAFYGVKIYPVAIGDPESVGEDALDMETLTRVAEITKGQFFQALDQRKLADIHTQILALEAEDYQVVTFEPRQSLHHYVVGAIALVLCLWWGQGLARGWVRRRHA